MSGRAKSAQVFPEEACRELCQTLKLQMETELHQLLMKCTESLQHDLHEQWKILEKRSTSTNWMENCYIYIYIYIYILNREIEITLVFVLMSLLLPTGNDAAAMDVSRRRT